MNPNDTDGAQGSSGGDQGQESRFSNEDVSKIVRDRLVEYDRSHKQDMDNLRTELQPKIETKVYSTTELNELVTKGDKTLDQANTILDNQQRQLTAQVATQTVQDMTQATQVQSSIDKYKSFDSNLMTIGSDSRNRIEAEVKTQMGFHNLIKSTPGIELAALRVVYGPEEGLGAGERDRQTHQEIPGGGELPGGENQDGSLKGLSKRERDYYTKRMDNGDYPGGWKDVEKELEYANPDIRRRAAAR